MPGLWVGLWVLWAVGWLWRRTVWERVGADARALAGRGEVVPVWAGWRVQGDGFTVVWRGGAFGVSTVVRGRAGTRRRWSLLTADEVRSLV